MAEQNDNSLISDDFGLEPEDGVIDVGNQPPFDPAKIDVVTQNQTIDALLSRLKYGEMDLSPDFQRSANLWDAVRKTSLIESILLRIPIPSLYVSEDDEGNYAVVDGLQRMSAIAHFVNVDALNQAVSSELKPLILHEKGLRSLQNLAGLSFEELDRPLQRRINETALTIHVIRSGTPNQVKFNIFSRINQGGLPLNAQEIRNAIYPGEWRNKIRALAESEVFLAATEGKVPTKRMDDLELVLRAVALHDQCKPRPNDQNLEDYLNSFVEDKCQHWGEAKWKTVHAHITAALIVAPVIFGSYVFRKYYQDFEKRKPINRGLFEAQIGVLSRFAKDDLQKLMKENETVIKEFIHLSDSSEYNRVYLGVESSTAFDIDQNELENMSKVFKDISSRTMEEGFLMPFDFRQSITVATSKGLASNKRVEAMQYIFDQALKSNEGHSNA